MTSLAVYSEGGELLLEATTDVGEIRSLLSDRGVLYDRWAASAPLTDAADQDEVLSAYAGSITELKAKYGFQSIDVVAMYPDNPNKAEFRQKFLSEHTHDDFEMRFFVEGKGLFYLHIEEKVYLVLCEKGDLLSVPQNVAHWFDMGEEPSFKCIRLFSTDGGWEANFTGSDIATRFIAMDEYVEGLA